MNQYFMNEELYLFLTDDYNLSENNVKKSYFKVSFDKPIQLNKQMECALVKLCSPTYLFTILDETELTLNLTINFIKIENYDRKFGLQEISNYDKGDCFNKEYKLEGTLTDEINIINKLKKLSDEMNIYVKKIWNQRWRNTSITEDSNEISSHAIYEKTDNGTDEDFPSATLFYHPIEIINQSNEITLKPGRIIIGEYKTPAEIINPIEICLVAYVELNDNLYKLLGLDESKKPINEYIPNGYVDIPIEIKLAHANLRVVKFYTKTQTKQTLNIDLNYFKIIPDIIYIYCDIVSYSYVSNQKVNILQMYVLENASKKEIETITFKNLIYMPLRIDEINSITIQMRDREGQILYYDYGSINAVLKIRPIEQI